MDDHTIFTKEALQAQDGKKVPLTSQPGGPVIGEATLHYDPETGGLLAQARVDDQVVAEFIKGNTTSVSFGKE